MFDTAGNLYGTAQFGGGCASAFGCGVVYKLSPTASGPWTETVLYSFQLGDDGGLPASQLVFDAAGNLYGTSIAGGSGSCGFGIPCGVVFELSPASGSAWTESVIYNFQGYADGAEPTGPVVFDTHGNLFGTTSIGGGFNQNCGYPFFGCGSVFVLSPGLTGWTKSTPYIFNAGHGGAYPADGVVIDQSGTVYGTATAGGSSQYCGASVPGCGVVYALRPNSGAWTESIAFAFSGGVGGQTPHGGLTIGAAGNLYGTASGGVSANGASGAGVVFKLSRSGNTWSETVLYTFPRSGSKGANPVSRLIRDADGNLYGTASSGGTANDISCNLTCGVVYKITP